MDYNNAHGSLPYTGSPLTDPLLIGLALLLVVLGVALYWDARRKDDA